MDNRIWVGRQVKNGLKKSDIICGWPLMFYSSMSIFLNFFNSTGFLLTGIISGKYNKVRKYFLSFNFSFTSQILSLITDVFENIHLYLGEKTGWHEVILEGPPEPSVVPSGGSSKRDPRQCYVKQLFYPGRFSIETLTKTLNIYKRSTDLTSGGSSLGDQMTLQVQMGIVQYKNVATPLST